MDKAEIEKIVKGSLAALFLQLIPTELLEEEIVRRKVPAALGTLFSPSEVILNELNLRPRTIDVLRLNNIVTLADLLKVKRMQLRKFRGIGDLSIKQLRAVCINYQVEWK